MSEHEQDESTFIAPPPRDEPDELAAERELDEVLDETLEPEGEQEAPQAAGPTPEEMDKRISQAEKSTKTYVTRINNLFDDTGQELIECPMCESWARGFVHPQHVGNFEEQQKNAILFVTNGIAQVAYLPSPRYSTCAGCDGYGIVRTGSKVPQNDTATCEECKGYGYTPAPGTAALAENGHADFHAPAGEHPAPAVTSDADDWGEPRKLPDGRDNPNFGKLPHFKIRVEPYGITAGLGAPVAVPAP